MSAVISKASSLVASSSLTSTLLGDEHPPLARPSTSTRRPTAGVPLIEALAASTVTPSTTKRVAEKASSRYHPRSWPRRRQTTPAAHRCPGIQPPDATGQSAAGRSPHDDAVGQGRSRSQRNARVVDGHAGQGEALVRAVEQLDRPAQGVAGRAGLALDARRRYSCRWPRCGSHTSTRSPGRRAASPPRPSANTVARR